MTQKITQQQRDEIVYEAFWSWSTHYEPSDTFITLCDMLEHRSKSAGADARDRDTTLTIADLGCGLGRHAFYAASRGIHAIAVDRHPRAIERLKERRAGLPLEIIQGDFVEWARGAADASIDGIVCFDAIHHVSASEQVVREVLADFLRVVKPGGMILCAFLSSIDYGSGGAPPDRLLVDQAGAERILNEAFSSCRLIRIKTTNVHFDNTPSVDMETGKLVRTHYSAIRVIHLYQKDENVPHLAVTG